MFLALGGESMGWVILFLLLIISITLIEISVTMRKQLELNKEIEIAIYRLMEISKEKKDL